jgi:hypothetical protein
MAGKIQKRWQTLCQVYNHRWVKRALAIWAFVAAYDTVSSQILPVSVANHAPKVREVIAMTSGWFPYWVWLLVLAGILVIASFEYAFRRASNVRSTSLERPPALLEQSPSRPTFSLFSLYKTDFDKDRYDVEERFTFEPELKVGKVPIFVTMYQDHTAKSYFLSFYTGHVGHENTVAVCHHLAKNLDSFLVKIMGGGTLETIGDFVSTYKHKLQFSKRVYIYNDVELNLEEKLVLLLEFKRRDVDLVLRGRDYLALKNLQH